MRTRPARRLPALVLPFLLAAALLFILSRLVWAAPAATARFASPTGSGFLCLQANPCRLVIAVGAASTGDTIYVKGGTYTGVGPAVITVTKSITIFGGWDGAPGGPNIRPYRNPTLYPTNIDGQNLRRAVFITGTIQPTLEGFIFTHGNASGLFAGCSASGAHACGGGMFVYHAGARIRNNTFLNNTAQLTAGDNHFVGYGGGLYLEVASGAIISNNIFMSNTAAAVFTGGGGGLAIEGQALLPPQIINNRFVGNVAPTWGGGVALGGDAYVNTFTGNQLQSNSALHGAGLYCWYAHINSTTNLFEGNVGDAAVYLGYSQGGLYSDLIVDNLTEAGIQAFNGAGGQLELTNSIIAHNGNLGIDAHSTPGWPLTIKIFHTTLVGAGAGAGVSFTGGPTTISLGNNLVSGFNNGFLTDTPTNTVLIGHHNLFDTDVVQVGNVPLTTTFVGQAAFVDPAGRDYHLLANSLAIDNAFVTTIGFDIDNDPRTIGAGPDIGADETPFIFPLFLPLARR